MAKLEGIVSSVHEVLGTLDMKQSSAASKLRSVMMPTDGDASVAAASPATLPETTPRTRPSVSGTSVVPGGRSPPGHQTQREQSPIRQRQQQQQQRQHLTTAPHSPLAVPWSPNLPGCSVTPPGMSRTRDHSPLRSALDATTNAWDVSPVQRTGQHALVDPVPTGSSSGCGGTQPCKTPPLDNGMGSIHRQGTSVASHHRCAANLAAASAFAAPPPNATGVANLLGVRGSQAAGCGACGGPHQALNLTHGHTPSLSLDAWSCQGVNTAPRSARSNGSTSFQPL